MSWNAILGFRLVTADLDRATAFYAALGFTVGARDPLGDDEMARLGLAGGGWRQALTLGPSRLELDAFERSGRPYPAGADAAASCFQHFALVTSAADAAWGRAQAAGATPISRNGPVTLPAASGGVTAIKFRDPDGHPLELLQFPADASTAWRGEGLLGIDHSAIAVSDIGRSRRFYEARGLRDGHAGVNQGPTQVMLDGLDDVVVDVVPLQPSAGPSHLELLGYRHPHGRAFGPIAINDIAATRLVWRADRAALLRDPDGHWHQTEGD